VHSLAHRARQRRLERASFTAQGNINLVPLVDILTSIVFFSLLTYRGEVMAQLTAYDLTLPPVVVSRPTPTPPPDAVELRLVVRIADDRLQVEHEAGGGFRREIAGVRGPALDTLGAVVGDLRRRYPNSRDVRVTPGDAVAYDDVVHVLERLRVAGFSAISLGGGTGTVTTRR
jgi:biopolymer transport protein ExbD